MQATESATPETWDTHDQKEWVTVFCKFLWLPGIFAVGQQEMTMTSGLNICALWMWIPGFFVSWTLFT